MVKPISRQKMSSSEVYPEFFKVYLPDTSSIQLKIPPAFVKYFNGVVPHKSILMSPGKRAWAVNMEKVDDKFFFEKGWQEFVEDNCIEFGDFLTFSYLGTSNFMVKIYGKNGCEKVTTKIREKEQSGKRGDNTSMADETCLSNWNDQFRSEDCAILQENQKRNTRKCKQLVQKERSIRQVTKRSRGSRVHMATEERDKVVDVASKHTSLYPHFKVSMKSAYIKSGTLNIPLSFARKYMKACKQVVTLRFSHKSWPAKLTIYANASCKFSGGWHAFVKENKLRQRDLCLFELTKRSDPTFKVSIIRRSN